MGIQTAINQLIEKEKPYLEIKKFSPNPGIYAFFFIGNKFPFLENKVNKHQLVYVGKTESSQEKRDAKTHFATGKTGSSTVRKSIGALLNTETSLTPIPRNNSDYKKGRFSHFKFDQQSEELITHWMKNNLALSFYEFNGSKEDLKILETALIEKVVPILNITKNQKNQFANKLKALRKVCAEQAHNK